MNKQKIYVLIMLLLVCTVFTHCTEKESTTYPETTELLTPSEETTVATEPPKETRFANELDRDYPDEIVTEPPEKETEILPTIEETVPQQTEVTTPVQTVPVETEQVTSKPGPTEAPTVDIGGGYETDRDI